MISPPLYLFGGGALVLAAAAGGGILPGGARGMLGAGGALLVALGLFSICVAVMFFMKKRIAPTLMIARYALDLVLGWVMVGITAAAAAGNATETAKDFGGAVRSTVIAVVWIAYFVQSQRVKNTFVN